MTIFKVIKEYDLCLKSEVDKFLGKYKWSKLTWKELEKPEQINVRRRNRNNYQWPKSLQSAGPGRITDEWQVRMRTGGWGQAWGAGWRAGLPLPHFYRRSAVLICTWAWGPSSGIQALGSLLVPPQTQDLWASGLRGSSSSQKTPMPREELRLEQVGASARAHLSLTSSNSTSGLD